MWQSSSGSSQARRVKPRFALPHPVVSLFVRREIGRGRRFGFGRGHSFGFLLDLPFEPVFLQFQELTDFCIQGLLHHALDPGHMPRPYSNIPYTHFEDEVAGTAGPYQGKQKPIESFRVFAAQDGRWPEYVFDFRRQSLDNSELSGFGIFLDFDFFWRKCWRH